MLVDIGAERFDPRLRVDRPGSGVGGGDGAAQHVGQCFVHAAGEAVEGFGLVETLHLERPLDRLAGAADRERAAGLTGDRHHAAVDFGRVGLIDRNLGLAGGPALFKRRIVEEGESDGALDLEHPVGGQKYRRRMSIDTRYRVPAMSSRDRRESRTPPAGCRFRRSSAVSLARISTIDVAAIAPKDWPITRNAARRIRAAHRLESLRHGRKRAGARGAWHASSSRRERNRGEGHAR